MEENGKVTAKYPDDTETLAEIVKYRIHIKDYNGAFEPAKKLWETAPEMAEAHFYIAVIFWKLNYSNLAIQEIGEAIDRDGAYFEYYELRLILFTESGHYDFAHEIIDKLEGNGLADEASVRWCRAWLDDREGKDRNDVLKAYESVAHDIEEGGEDTYWTADFYKKYAILFEEVNADNGIYDRQGALDILEKGLSSDSENPELLDYKAWLLKKMRRYGESQTLYERLVKIPHNGTDTETDLASVYYRRKEKYADKALALYDYILANCEKEDSDIHHYAGICCHALGKYADAEKHFLREEELAPDEANAYYHLGYLYAALGRYDEALAQADKAVEIVRTGEEDRYNSIYFTEKMCILRKMGRWAEAAETAAEAEKYCDGGYTKYNDIADIRLQAGDFEKSEEIFAEWEKYVSKYGSKKDVGDMRNAEMMHLIRQGRADEAAKIFAKDKRKLSKDDAEDIDILLDTSEENIAKYLKSWQRRYRATVKEDMDYPLMVVHYAEALWLAGDEKKSKKKAQEALDILEKGLREYHTNRSVYMAQHALALYLLDRNDEAEEELFETENRPMCDYCPYSECKDAPIYRVAGLIHQGRYDEAEKLAAESLKKWPDETDFILYMNLLKSFRK